MRADAAIATVVIPARNEEPHIDACLQAITRQDRKDIQIIVVDGDSEDRTVDVVRRWMERDPRIELIHNDRRSISTSLNMALSAAAGTYLVRVDAHSTVPPDYVSTAVELLESGRWAGVGGRKDAVGRTPVGRAIAMALSSRFGVGGSIYHYGTAPQETDHVPFGAYPVPLVRSLGGWDESIEANEDYEFDYRVRCAGHRLLFDPRLRIEWVCRQSFGELFRQYERYGRGKAKVTVKHPRSLRPRHLAPPALTAALLLTLATARRRPGRTLALAGGYAAALTLGSMLASPSTNGTRARRYLPGVLAIMHIAWGIGFWRGLSAALARLLGHHYSRRGNDQ